MPAQVLDFLHIGLYFRFKAFYLSFVLLRQFLYILIECGILIIFLFRQMLVLGQQLDLLLQQMLILGGHRVKQLIIFRILINNLFIHFMKILLRFFDKPSNLCFEAALALMLLELGDSILDAPVLKLELF